MAAQKKKTDSSCKLLPLPAGKKKLRSTANPASPFFSSNLLPCCCWFAAAATAFLLLSFPSSATVAAAQTPRENDIARSQVLRTLQSQMMSEAATLTPAPTPTSITQETPASAAKHYSDKSNSTSRGVAAAANTTAASPEIPPLTEAEINDRKVLESIRVDAIALILAQGMGDTLPPSAAIVSSEALKDFGSGGAAVNDAAATSKVPATSTTPATSGDLAPAAAAAAAAAAPTFAPPATAPTLAPPSTALAPTLAPPAAVADIAKAAAISSTAVAAAKALPPIISKQEAIDSIMGGRSLPPHVTEAELEKIQARKFAFAVAAAASGTPGAAAAGASAAGASSSASSSSESSNPVEASAPKPLNITGARPGAVGANIGFIGGVTPGSLFVSSSTGKNATTATTTTTTTTTNTVPLLLDNRYQWSPTGTNAYYMSAGFWLSRDEILRQMELHASKGVNTLRVFVAYDFDRNVGTQTSWGVFNELALINMDHVFAAAAMHGIRIIPVLSNYWPFVGGIKAWVDNYISATPGAAANQPKEAFFTNPAIRDMFKKWVRLVVTRTNTETGVTYSQVSWWWREEVF